MTHAAGITPAIRQLHPQLGSEQWKPFTPTEGPTLAITGPDAGKIPSIALRCVNIQILGKAKPRELAPHAVLKAIRRRNLLEVGLGR